MRVGVFTILLLFCIVYFAEAGKIFSLQRVNRKRQNYALLVSGGVRWFQNYMHQSAIAGTYKTLRANGLPAENIIVMSYDDAAIQDLNPCKGKLFNTPILENVYDATVIDYRDKDVTPENVLNIMSGAADKVTGGNGRVINSSAGDRIFLFLNSEGISKPAALVFQDETRLWAKDFVSTLKSMKTQKKFSEMVVFLDTDAGAAFLEDLPTDLGVYAVTNTNEKFLMSHPVFCATESCGGRLPCLNSEFSYDWLEDVKRSNISERTFSDQIEFLKDYDEDYERGLTAFGDLTIGNKTIGSFMSFNN